MEMVDVMDRMDTLDAMDTLDTVEGRSVGQETAGRMGAVEQKTARIEVEIRAKKDFDWSVTGQSNWGLAFVFNKSLTPGWG